MDSESASDAETPMLQDDDDDTVNGAVDHKGEAVRRSKSGNWRSAWFIIGVEVGERFAYYGIMPNLITYLTGPLHFTTAAAAESVNLWIGIAGLMPLLGAFIADSYLGRYPTILLASLVYILGLGLMAISAMPLTNSDCNSVTNSESCSSNFQVILFFIALYLVALGQGGHKPCVEAFGADQFDQHHPRESKDRSSFFNWWFTKNEGNQKNAFVRIGRVYALAIRNRRASLSDIKFNDEISAFFSHPCSKQFNFLHKALLAPNGSKEQACSLTDVEEAKAILRLVPILVTNLIYGIVFAQVTTFFTKQGATMDRTIFPGFDVPPASLQSIVYSEVVILSPLYDRVFVPIARSITKKPTGITMLQRIGTGLFFSMTIVVVAAVVEMKRLRTAEEYGIVDDPNAIVPMSVWWLIPQYLLYGISQVFAMIGQQEFFYDQVPDELRSMGLALYLSIYGVGCLLSSLLISVIEEVTSKYGQGRAKFLVYVQIHQCTFYTTHVYPAGMGVVSSFNIEQNN
ncbi:protein NRT1/ PTR FAMILY 5.10-like [Senna tora]|uniref:Protein NRT1/ PTR FAMILY 5.10-like n=1 Tax=Senna tora TaxID=362788 RepID=A0A834X0X5_9FABA|nr:protein NRT1/ PTR FAMILY 5.10-like [Senna tora]